MRIFLAVFLLVIVGFSLLSFPLKEFRLGVRVCEKLEEKFSLYEDRKAIQEINQIGVRIASSIPSSYPITFNILDVEEANALAIPGGFIYLTRGVFELNPSRDELAFILGHEIAHLEKRHLFQLKRVKNLLDLLLITLAYPILREGETAEETQAKLTLLELSRVLMEKRYTREQEKEADYWGRIYATKAGFKDAAREFFQKLDFWKEKRPEKVRLIFSTHPYVEERIKEARVSFKSSSLPQDKERAKKWAMKIQEFLWENRAYQEEIILRNLYQLDPETSLAGKAKLTLLLRKEKEREKKGEFYYLLKEGRELLEKYPELEGEEKLKKKIKVWETKYKRDKEIWEKRVSKGEKGVNYEKFLYLFPDSSLRKEVWERLIKQAEKQREGDKVLAYLLRLKKEFPEVDIGKEGEKWIGEAKNLKILLDFFSYLKGESIRKRIFELLRQEKRLEVLSRLSNFPDKIIRESARERMDEVVEDLYRLSRMKEEMGEKTVARKIEGDILKYAPDSPVARRIREEIRRREFLREGGSI